MLHTVIIDDSKSATEYLSEMLLTYLPQVDILGTATDVTSGISLLRKCNPDLIFLDVELKNSTGFELLKSFPKINFEVIFVTGFDKYAINAFNHKPLHYLLKPIEPVKLIEAVNRFDPKKNNSKNLQHTTLNSDSPPNIACKKVAINTERETKFIKLCEVMYVKADGRYSVIHLTNNRKIIVSKLLKDVGSLLPHNDFFRVSKSYLVNLNYIKMLKHIDGGLIEMSDGANFSIPRRRRDDFAIRMSEFLI